MNEVAEVFLCEEGKEGWDYFKLNPQDFLDLNSSLDTPLKMRFVEDEFYQNVPNSYADLVLVQIEY